MTTLIALGITLLAFLVIVFLALLRAKGQARPTSQQAQPSPTPAPPTPPSPAPAPAPKTNWVWPVIIGILAIVVVIWVIAPMMTKSTTAPAPKVAAPKKEPKQYTVNRPLELLGGERIIQGSGFVGIRKGGKAEFRTTNLPIVKGGKYKITFHATRKTTGRDCLLINAGKGNGGPFYYENHPASDHPIRIVFFGEGMPGDPKYFYPTDNFIQLSADDDLLVQMDQPPYVEITYWQ